MEFDKVTIRRRISFDIQQQIQIMKILRIKWLRVIANVFAPVDLRHNLKSSFFTASSRQVNRRLVDTDIYPIISSAWNGQTNLLTTNVLSNCQMSLVQIPNFGASCYWYSSLRVNQVGAETLNEGWSSRVNVTFKVDDCSPHRNDIRELSLNVNIFRGNGHWCCCCSLGSCGCFFFKCVVIYK